MKKFSFLLTLLLVSCATKKDIVYSLSEIKDANNFKFSELIIQKGDVLDIKVHSLNSESTKIFQINPGQIQSSQPELLKVQGFLVNGSGEISYPIIGNLIADGLTTSQFAENLQKQLKPLVKDVTVNVRLVNYKVSVLGEVASPGTFTFLEEQITLPQVIGTAGDLTINGDRSNVTLVRKIGDELKTYKIDLTKGDLINPDYFYLQQNDMVYIPPNTARVKSAGLIGNVGTLVSVLSLMVSLTILITR